jgi:NAD(P)H-hydrate repair Nnr-like enzyme with NAD(P)H-hydrate epimerase domain/8-oxo-dGTP pyrophosphatase MutT (NUDIX family)
MSVTARRWERLRSHLDAHGATEVGNAAGRVGAVLALLAERDDDDLELILTRRRDDLPTHPGQVSFPGGRRESGESTTAAALREAHEEIGLRTDSVEVLGHLPAFFIPPSRYWLAPVVARWVEPHALRPQETEVAALVHAPLAHLLDLRRWRKVRLSMTGWSLAWQLDGDHVLWGATAAVTAVLLDVLEPGWRASAEPAALSDDLEIMPWLDPGLDRRMPAPSLTGVGTRERRTVPAPAGSPPDMQASRAAGAAIVAAIDGLRDQPERIVVLAGGGHNGAAGVAAATLLQRRGAQVSVVATHPERLARDGHVLTFAGTVPPADLYVDALVGGGLRGRLRGTPLAMLHALRMYEAPILAVDLPTGLHPTDGLIGDTLAATVTLALQGVWPVLTHAAVSPFVGDLYLWEGPGPDIVRLVAGPERAAVHGGLT